LIDDGGTKLMLNAAELEKRVSFNLEKRRAGRDL
jgi:hypothetical protein